MPEDPEVVEERRRHAQAVAAQHSKAMEAGYRHLLGHEEPVSPDDDEPRTLPQTSR